MFTRQALTQVSLHLSYRLEMLLGMLALQNPHIFYPDSCLLRPFVALKHEAGELLVSLTAEHDLINSEHTLSELIAHEMVPGFVPQINIEALGSLCQRAWELGGEQLWVGVEPQYRTWWDEVRPTTAHQVIALAEAAQGARLEEVHRRLFDRATRIIVIPTFLAYPQLGFNPIGDALYLIVGLHTSMGGSAASNYLSIPTGVAVASFSALGDERRMTILQLLLQSESLTGVELAERLGITPATVSHHLSTLAQHGLVSRERNGREVLYAPDRSRLAVLGRFLSNMVGR